MKGSHTHPRRHHPIHGVRFPPGHRIIVFLTVCTRRRGRWLATEDCHALLVSIWRRAVAWRVGRYVILPDHLHLFAAPGELNADFDGWVTYWKSQFSKSHRNPEHRWSVDHWDRRLRAAERYDDKWDYVVENPVRHGLAARAQDRPYQGEVFELPW
ncbi:MAG: transposase [Phycisphaerae bacterium]